MKTKVLIWAVLCACIASAQTVTTTPIRDTVYDQFGRLYSGSLKVSLSTAGATSASAPIVSVVNTKQIGSGVLSLDLIPNDTAVHPSGTSYILTFGNGLTKYCAFPTSSTPLKLDPYCTNTNPNTLTANVPINWLNGGTTAPGFYCLQVISGGQVVATPVSSGNCGSGGGGGGTTWSTVAGTWGSNSLTW
jgi:hypothetical protein